MTAIVDYGAGNLTSVRYALAACGVEATVTNDPEVIRAANRIVFPGVGAAKSAMENLFALGLVEVVRAAAETKPFLGICLGMQILFTHSEEDGGVETLGVLPGRVRRFPSMDGFKIPEIGWNQVRFLPQTPKHPNIQTPKPPNIQTPKHPNAQTSQAEYYFVHSYYAELGPYTAGVTDYAGVEFTAFARRGPLWACQFHPEKSGRVGLNLIKEWLSC